MSDTGVIQAQSGGNKYKPWLPTNDHEAALDKITQRVFDCHWNQLEKQWTKDAITARYARGERE